MNNSAQPTLNHPSPETTNDYHQLPVTEKQINFARKIAQSANITLPWDVQGDRRALSSWIDANRQAITTSPFASYPSSKQVAFAERIARIKRRIVPQECFRDKGLMSLWIDRNR